MATSNFGSVNTLHTYAFGFCEREEGNAPDEVEAEISAEYTVNNVCEDWRNMAGKHTPVATAWPTNVFAPHLAA